MPQRSLERVAAASGLALVAFLVAARAVAPRPVLPEMQAGGLVRSYYLDHRTLLQVRSVLVGLGALAALALVAAIVELLRRDGRQRWLAGAALAGGTAAVALWLAAGAALAGLVELRQDEVLGATQGSAAGAFALFHLYVALVTSAAWPLVAFVAAVSAGALPSGLLPRWLCLAGFGVAGLVLLGLVLPPLSLAEPAEYVLWLWLAALSVLLSLRSRRPEPSAVA